MSEPWWFNDQQMCSGCYKCSAEYKKDVWLKLNKSILIVEAVSGSLVDFARLSVTGPRLLEWCCLLVQARTPELTVSRLANCFWWQLHQQTNERKTVSKQCSVAFSGESLVNSLLINYAGWQQRIKMLATCWTFNHVGDKPVSKQNQQTVTEHSPAPAAKTNPAISFKHWRV